MSEDAQDREDSQIRDEGLAALGWMQRATLFVSTVYGVLATRTPPGLDISAAISSMEGVIYRMRDAPNEADTIIRGLMGMQPPVGMGGPFAFGELTGYENDAVLTARTAVIKALDDVTETLVREAEPLVQPIKDGKADGIGQGTRELAGSLVGEAEALQFAWNKLKP